MIALALLALAAPTPVLEVRGDAGAQWDAAPHGIVDLGLRYGPWSAELYTDTLELRWAPARAGGRAFVAARFQALASQLLIAPWTDGAPDPSRALISPHAALEAGAYSYLPHGLYLGVEGRLRGYLFFTTADNAGPAPDPTLVASADGIVGYWSPALELRLQAGTDVTPDRVAPRASGYFRLRPDWPVGPHVEIWGGAARGQDDLLKSRLGGLNPYVVPLAGAGWAELWVEDYATLRVGPRFVAELGELRLAVSTVADLALYDSQRGAGLALLGRLDGDPWFVELSGGYVPWLERQPGVSRFSGFLLAGIRWSGI